MKKIFALLAIFAVPVSAIAQDATGCVAEVWKKEMRGHIAYMTGATNCEKGKLVYRLFEDKTGEFLTSGFEFFDGFAFGAYTSLNEWPESVDMKYTIYHLELDPPIISSSNGISTNLLQWPQPARSGRDLRVTSTVQHPQVWREVCIRCACMVQVSDWEKRTLVG